MKACAEETRSSIISEIGERNFIVLVDESCDKSIKEQMTVILRFVATFYEHFRFILLSFVI